MEQQRLKHAYLWVIIVSAAIAILFCAIRLPMEALDARSLAVAVLTIAIGSRLTVGIPSISGHISVSDTFFFLTILVYSGEAAGLLAAAETLCLSLRFSKKEIHVTPLTISFNSAIIASSTFLTFASLWLFFGDVAALRHGQFSGSFVAILCVMALVQYAGNCSLAAIHPTYKMNEPLRQIWSRYYLWSSIAFFAGASAAGIISKIIDAPGFYALVGATPIVAIVYFTYRTYLRNIEVMAAAAKAEEAAAHAAEAERHVAELNHYIEEQERIREQFTQIEKMSALGELASGVAHDFNNTLAGILGRAQLLLDTKDPARIRKGLNIIIKTAKDGARTVKRIQDFARQRRDHDFQLVDVRQLLFDIAEITRPRWKDRAEAGNVHINLEMYCERGVMIMGDESELREVLVNLIFNAVDAMPRGGTLTMAARQANESIELSVRDTGTGMTEETRLRVFDPFFTTKDKLGMGLGLAVSYGIIRRHEATVDVESQLGAGSTFRIHFPVPTCEMQAAAPDRFVGTKQLSTQLDQTRILVVDDEKYVRDLLRDILEKEGCEAVVAEGGREALSLFDGNTFHAVFTDVGMPDMNGWELSRAVRQRNSRIPVAVITGWGEAVGSHAKETAQVNWAIAKPFDAPQIVEMVREVSRRRSGGGQMSVVAA